MRRRAANQRRRARKRNALVERFDDVEIFERDGWRCGLCGDRVDRSLQYPDVMSASLDHVVPLDQGGEHSRANVQCAHFICNSQKGAAGEPQQLRLVG